MKVTGVGVGVWCDQRRRKGGAEWAAVQGPVGSTGLILIKGLVTLEQI